MFQNVEFVLKNLLMQSKKFWQTKTNTNSLSVAVFKMAGTDLFEIIFNNKIQIPFLLLTAGRL